MNILIIADDYLPTSKKVSAKMLHELAYYFKSQQHSVTCVVANAYGDKPYELLDGVQVYRFDSGQVKNVNKVRRLINELRFSNKVWKTIKSIPDIQVDLVVYYSPSIFFGKAIKKIKQGFKAKSYLILRDFFPQWAVDHGLIKENALITKLLRYYEKINYQAADNIGVMSPANLRWFNQYTKNDYVDRTHVLYNWVDPTFLDTIKIDSEFRKRYNLEGKVIFIYGGNIGHAQDLMNIVKLAERLKNKSEAFFLLIGQGDEYAFINKRIEELRLTNTLLLPAMSQREYFAIQKAADIGVFCLNKHHQTHNFPGKILGYLSQPLPLLGSVNPNNDLLSVINDNKVGLVSVTGDEDTLYANAIELLNEKSRKEYRANARKLVISVFSVKAAVEGILVFRSRTY